jgi:hypothetical protein
MEVFASAFKTRILDQVHNVNEQTVPGVIYNTESGLVIPIGGAWSGLADFGTRFKATFSNLPHGITLSVDAVQGAGTTPLSTAVLVANSTATGADAVADTPTFGGPVGIAGTSVTCGINTFPSVAPLTITYLDGPNTGSAQAVWEVTNANPFSIDQFNFNVYLTFTGAPGTPGTPDITGPTPPAKILSYAPTANGGSFTVATGGVAGDSSVPIPRFVDPTTTPETVFTVSLCQTILLFPYVTDFPGFDTGLAISNTSMDPLGGGLTGASPQTGACTVTFYGTPPLTTSPPVSTAPPPYSSVAANVNGTGLIGPGQTWTFDIANPAVDPAFGTPTFQGFVGYAIAQCNFQYAHGYSFVSDYGLRNFAAAYLALIIPDTSRAPLNNICSALSTSPSTLCQPTGEQLVH